MAKPQILGTIPLDTPTVAAPAPTDTQWVSGSGAQVDLTEPPPPWEAPGNSEFLASDARRFVDVPDNWCLRWINPRLLESEGWRDWQPVKGSDPKVTVRVNTMLAPDNTVRRGGADRGDILCWMYQSWVASREKQFQAATDRLTASAPAKQRELQDDFRRGKYGPHLHLDAVTHPTHTMAEGKTLERD